MNDLKAFFSIFDSSFGLRTTTSENPPASVLECRDTSLFFCVLFLFLVIRLASQKNKVQLKFICEIGLFLLYILTNSLIAVLLILNLLYLMKLEQFFFLLLQIFYVCPSIVFYTSLDFFLFATVFQLKKRFIVLERGSSNTFFSHDKCLFMIF